MLIFKLEVNIKQLIYLSFKYKCETIRQKKLQGKKITI